MSFTEQTFELATLEMPSAERGLSNNRTDEDMKSAVRF